MNAIKQTLLMLAQRSYQLQPFMITNIKLGGHVLGTLKDIPELSASCAGTAKYVPLKRDENAAL